MDYDDVKMGSHGKPWKGPLLVDSKGRSLRMLKVDLDARLLLGFGEPPQAL